MYRNAVRTLAILLVIAIVLTSGCAGKRDETPALKKPVRHSSYDLPLETRDFHIGVVPIPMNRPNATWQDIASAYEETGRIAEVTMVWPDPSGIGQLDALKRSRIITALEVYGLKPVITLSFATIEEFPGEGLKYVIKAPAGVNPGLADPEFRELWVSEARDIAAEFKPEYFSLGNEINDYFFLNPDQLDDYVSLYDEAYSAIKEASPQTKVFAVFSYTHLIDTGQWELLERFDSRADMIGLTTYPWKHYDDPDDIPDEYYSQLESYATKPVAFTEIGWISSALEGSSGDEQARFLIRFLELTRGMDVEMVNWLFLHGIELTGITAKVTDQATNTVSLKNADGSEKEIYGVWLDLYELG